MNEVNVFPYDPNTLFIIIEIEAYLGMRNKDIDKISYTELIKYIDEITSMLLYK